METPTRVLLVGSQWEALEPALLPLTSMGDMVFLGPVRQDIGETASRLGPSVVVVGPSFDYEDIFAPGNLSDAQPVSSAILICITPDALERDDLYEGAADFLVVPCAAAELEKRIRRLARKSQAPSTPSRLEVGRITLDLATYQVTLGGKRVDLAWMEFQLLKFFMQQPGKVFTREQLLAYVWGIEDFGGTRTVDVHIRRLRSKLGLCGDQYFRTVKNVGYGMVQPD